MSKVAKIYNSKFEYHDDVSLEVRKKKTVDTLLTNPTRIPVWLDFVGCTILKDVVKTHKFLTPDHLTLAGFIDHLRTKNSISSERGLYIFINNKIPQLSSTLVEVYSKEKDEDGMLYITIRDENVFG